MAVDKVIRMFSEKTTSVDTRIPMIQTGTLNCRRATSGYIVVPTNIPNPTLVKIMPTTGTGATIFSKGFSCDMTKYYASNTNVSAALKISATSAVLKTNTLGLTAAQGKLVMYVGSKVTQASIASATLIASNSVWRKVDGYGSNAQAYLAVLPKYGSTSGTGNVGFAYEVIGYSNFS